MTAVLSVSGLSVRFGGNQVLDGFTLDVPAGFTGLVGPNGAGKTTVFNVVNGYVPAAAGELRLGGEPITGRSPVAIARLGVGRTFQAPKLVGRDTVLDNVLLGLDGRLGLAGHARSLVGLRRWSRPAVASAIELLERFGIADRRFHGAASLPLGTQKLVELARALVARPRLVLLDEPAAGLGSEDVDRIVAPLRSVAAEAGLAVLIIEHDLALVGRLCPLVAVLHSGRVIASGPPAEALSEPAVVDAYLGAGFAAVDR